MKIAKRVASAVTGFSLREYEALRSLRKTYEEEHDLLSERELARLRFVRWLIQSPEWNTALDQALPTLPGTTNAAPDMPWIHGSIAVSTH